MKTLTCADAEPDVLTQTTVTLTIAPAGFWPKERANDDWTHSVTAMAVIEQRRLMKTTALDGHAWPYS